MANFLSGKREIPVDIYDPEEDPRTQQMLSRTTKQPNKESVTRCCWICEYIELESFDSDGMNYMCDKRGMDISLDVMHCKGKDFQLKKELR